MIRISELVIAESEDFIAINKPSGLLTIPDREGKDVSLKLILKERFGEIFTVHRLDRETSGIVLFAKNEASHKHFSAQFESRETTKIYHGLVLGSLAKPSGVINEPIGEHPGKKGVMTVLKKGKESITEFELLETFRFYSWVKFKILTGRTHQIRVHSRHLGHPIVADPVYGDGKPVLVSSLKAKFNLSQKEDEEKPLLGRLALHASLLQVKDLKGNELNLEALLPKDLRATLNQLRKTTR